ncbi:transposase [Burkholderia sp. Bp9125]|nr:transposase [Burkholderia sp. Bp9125]
MWWRLRLLRVIFRTCRTGRPWRDLPKEFGRWHTVYMRISPDGVAKAGRSALHAMTGETEHALIDSTIGRPKRLLLAPTPQPMIRLP